MFQTTKKPWLASLMLAAAFLFSLPAMAMSTTSIKAGEAIAQGVRVKLSSNTVVTAGLTDTAIGVAVEAADNGAPVTVKCTNDGEIESFIASAAISAGADVYPAASGKVSSTASGKRIGVALKAVAADGDIVSVLRTSAEVDRVFLTVPIAAASVDSWAFTADRPYTVVGIREVHTVAGSDGGAVTLDLRKVTDATAPGAAAGSTVKEFLTTALNLKSTANTSVTGTLTATTADLDLATGDKIGLNFIGTLTALAGGVVQIELKLK